MLNMFIPCCTEIDDICKCLNFQTLNINKFHNHDFKCTGIEIANLSVWWIQMCSNISTASIDRSNSCSKCTVCRYNQSTRMWKQESESRIGIQNRGPQASKPGKPTIQFGPWFWAPFFGKKVQNPVQIAIQTPGISLLPTYVDSFFGAVL